MFVFPNAALGSDLSFRPKYLLLSQIHIGHILKFQALQYGYPLTGLKSSSSFFL